MLTRAHADVLADHAHPLTGAPTDYDGLLDRIGDSPLVLVGEASHGTDDFYAERARLTRRLVEDRGFTAIALEADWPDADRVDNHVMGSAADTDAALDGFRRFPTWMWRNTVTRDFVSWLRRHNDARPDAARRVRVVGLDLYSLRASMDAVVGYLETVDPDAAGRARDRYACFDHVGADGQAYGHGVAGGQALPCEAEVVAQLVELRRREPDLGHDGGRARDALFSAQRNAVVVRDAERYYQQMYRGTESTWNLRDRHMADTLEALVDHLTATTGRRAKVIVWEHNSHVGDSRATTAGARGQVTVGRLVRERVGAAAFLVGLTTYDGEVTAAPDWGRPALRWRVRPALRGSHEEVLHDVGVPRFWLDLHSGPVRDVLVEARLERAIGVVYRPVHERQSHYVLAHLADQFDAVVHLDRTRALVPLERTTAWERGAPDPPDTYPSGL